jgi:hypothetical protein
MEQNFDYVQIYTAYGTLQGEMIRAFLESNGIKVFIAQESVGMTYGLTVGPLGEARIYVPVNQKEIAEKLLEEMEDGSLTSNENSDSELPENLSDTEDDTSEE